MRTLLFTITLLSCDDKTATSSDDSGHESPGDSNPDADGATDADGDGYTRDVDCDDDDPEINPGACETCDGIDRNCSGVVGDGDDTARVTLYLDEDDDGHGARVAGTAWACDLDELKGGPYSQLGGDCDDVDLNVHPGAAELCTDGVDNDCDGLQDCEDEDCPEYACSETSCADGRDDDDDGYTDCLDDDCWGSTCGHVVARVTGGTLAVRKERSVKCEGGDCATRRKKSAIGSVMGTVRAYSADGLVLATCDWSLSEVDVRLRSTSADGSDNYVSYYHVSADHTMSSDCTGVSNEVTLRAESTISTYTHANIQRTGFVVEPGCGVETGAFLPDELNVTDKFAAVLPDGGVWYDGEITLDRFWTSTGWGSASSSYGTMILSTQDTTRGPVEE